MATLTVVSINNKAVTAFAKQFNYDQITFGPVAYVPANNSPSFATGLAMFMYDEGLGRSTKYIVSDSLATTRAYFLAAGSLRTTAVPASAELPSIGVGVYSTPVVETGTDKTAAAVFNLNTATNKTIAGDISAAIYAESKNTAAVAHATIVTLDSLTTTRGDVYEAYGVRTGLTIAVATATHESFGMLASVFGKTTITGAVSQGLVAGGAFIVAGAGAVTQTCYGVYVSSLTGVTAMDALIYATNAGDGTKGLELAGTLTTGITVGASTTGISVGAATTGLTIAACTTAIALTGAVTAGISITGNATTAIEVKTGTVVTGISLAACTTGIALTGAMTTGISITGAATTAISISGNTTSALKVVTGTVTNVIEVGTAANATNFIKFNAVGGCLVAKDVVPSAAPDAGKLGADACLTILVNATPYYIPLYDTQHA